MAENAKSMSFDELTVEFKDLAGQLQPLNARRKVLADELASRADESDAMNRMAGMTEKQKRSMFERLKREFGR